MPHPNTPKTDFRTPCQLGVLSLMHQAESVLRRLGLHWLCLLWVLLAMATPTAQAAIQNYQIYVDSDLKPTSGCSVTLNDKAGSITPDGLDYRLSFSVDDQGQSSAPVLAACTGGTFAGEQPTGTIAPNPYTNDTNPTALLDQIELSVPLSALGNPGAMRLVLASQGDYLASTNPQSDTAIISLADGGEFVSSSPIPALSTGLGLLLAAALAAIAWRIRPHSGKARLLAVTLGVLLGGFSLSTGVGSSLSWATNQLVIDGKIDDWQGIAPIATDAPNDQRSGTPDLLRLTLQRDSQQLYLRIDAQGNNHPPYITNLPASASLPTLTVGQPWQIKLHAQDPDADQPLAWQIVSAPAGYNLIADNASGSSATLIATPTAAGSATLTLRVTDPHGGYVQKDLILQVTDAPIPHQPPQITSSPSTSATVGQPWNYAVSARDPNTPPGLIQLSLTQAPAGMSLSAATAPATLQWNPTVSGTYVVTLVATDNQSVTSTQSWQISVAAVVDEPGDIRETTPLDTAAAQARFLTQPILIAQVGKSWSYQVRAHDASGTPLSVSLRSAPVGVRISGTAPDQIVEWSPTNRGEYAVTLDAGPPATPGRPSQTFLLGVSDDSAVPPDPATRATPLLATGFTPFADSTAFLYTGADPIQTGVAPGTIKPVTASVLRGRVLDKSGQPLAGVTVKIQGQPQYGQTLSRADGWYDLAVNGGGVLTLHLQKPGYLSAQRKISAPWRDWAIADDVVLITRSRQYSGIQLGANAPSGYQLGWGAQSSDNRGTRRPVALFPPGLQAQMTFANGSTQPLEHLTWRATEYTVGDNGPQTMPGELPITVTYTYAADFSSDEAEAAGARSVQFSQPVPVYVNNFIGAPVGTAVPAGWYDFERTAWIGEDNGRVVKVRAIVNGKAVLQVGTEDRAATAQELLDLGITEGELQTLASLYGAGTELWRVGITHMTPYDFNWPPPTLPDDAEQPPQPEPEQDDPPAPLTGSCNEGGETCTCPGEGCDIHFEARAVGQSIPLPGTAHGLYYRSDRVALSALNSQSQTYRYRVQVTGAQIPASLRTITLVSDIAGTRRTIVFPAQGLSANASQLLEWDGRDAYRRKVPAGAMARISLRHEYQAVFRAISPYYSRAFERLTPFEINGNFLTGATITVLSKAEKYIYAASPDVQSTHAGNWAITNTSWYDADRGIRYESGGTQRHIQKMPRSFQRLTSVPYASQFLFTPDGTLVYTAPGRNQILQIRLGAPQDSQTVLAGSGDEGSLGDGGPAQAAQLAYPTALASGPDGSIYVMDSGNQRLRQIGPDGNIRTIAGNGQAYSETQADGPAMQRGLSANSIAVRHDQNILMVTDAGTLLQLTPSGHLYRVVLPLGAGAARQVVTNAQGTIWVSTARAIYAIGENSQISLLKTGISISAMSADLQGGLYYLDFKGDRDTSYWLNYINPAQRSMQVDNQGWYYDIFPGRLIITPDNKMLVANGPSFGELRTGFPSFGGNLYSLPRADGQQVDEYDAQGRQIATRSAFNGSILYSYLYDSAGYLQSTQDPFGNQTLFERDASHRLTAVVSPFGERSTLAYHADGSLATVINPGGATHQLRYNSTPGQANLLTEYHDPRGGIDRFSYNAARQLVRNDAPDGGGWSLATLADGSIQATTAENRQKTLTTQSNNPGWTDQTTVNFDGTTTIKSTSGHIVTSLVQPDRTIISTNTVGDPRFGMASSFTWTRADFNSSSRTVSTTHRTMALHDEDDLYSLNYWRQSDMLNRERSYTTTYTANDWGRRFTQTTPSGRQTETEVDTWLRPEFVYTPSGAVLGYQYDARGRLSSLDVSAWDDIHGAIDRSSTLGYHPQGNPGAGQIASLTDPLGRQTLYTYDQAARLQTQTLPDGRSLQYQYDAAGNLSALTTPAGVEHRFDYTLKDRVSGYTAPAAIDGGSVDATRWVYNRDRLLTQVQRPGGQTLQLQRDGAGRLQTLTDGNHSTQYNYQADGRIRRVAADAGSQAIDLRYDGGELRGLDVAQGSTTAHIDIAYERFGTYDGIANSLTSPRPAAITLGVDGHSPRTVNLAYNSEGETVRSGPLQLGRQYTSGLPNGITLNAASTAQTFNPLGELTQSETVVQDVQYAGSSAALRVAVRAQTGVLAGLLGSEIVRLNDCRAIQDQMNGDVGYVPPEARIPPDWQETNPCLERLQRDAQSLESLTQDDGNLGWKEALLWQIQSMRDSYGRGAQAFIRVYDDPPPPMGSTSYITAEAQALLNAIEALLTASPPHSFALQHAYQRDKLGRITGIRSIVRGLPVPAQSFTYTLGGQLQSVTHGEGASATTTGWTYDANGNRTHENGTAIAQYDRQDRLTQWKSNTYSYNAAGDLQEKTNPAGTSRYSYDAQGNLREASLPDGKTIRYDTDPLNRRTGKTVNGVQQWKLVWMDSLRPLAQLKPDGSLRALFYYGDKPNVPEAMEKEGTLYRIVSDHLGSVRLVLNANTGAIAQQMDYDVWGQVTSDSNPNFQPFGYAGGLYDGDTKLTRFGARDYDAEVGRWTAKDPILFDGGDSSLYGYVGGSPLNAIDPHGLWSVTFGAYAGPGGQVTFGSSNGNGFLTGRVGLGVGGGFSYNPSGSLPGAPPNDPSQGGVVAACSVNASFNTGPLQAGVQLGAARNYNNGASSWLAPFSGNGRFSNGWLGGGSIWNLNANANVGAQITIYGGR